MQTPVQVPYNWSIDGLRGLLAIAVMLYHGLYGAGIAEPERVAYYAVYGFFVISGFALNHVYRERLRGLGAHWRYFLRRYLRIAPLFLLVLAVTLWIRGIPAESGWRLLMNVTLIFGAFDPGATSLVMAGWSIGIEFVFYFVFPVILLIGKRQLWRLIVMAVLATGLGLYHANSAVDPDLPRMTADIWRDYTQPQAFLGYFLAGIVFSELNLKVFASKSPGASAIIWLPIVGILFALLPFLTISVQSPLQLISGLNGIVLMAATMLLVFSASFLPISKESWLGLTCKWLGIISYGTYLIHPLVQLLLSRYDISDGLPRIALGSVISILLALIVYFLIENPIRRLGRNPHLRAEQTSVKSRSSRGETLT